MNRADCTGKIWAAQIRGGKILINGKRLIPATRLELYDVVGPGDENLGQIQNFMIDPENGRVAFVVLSFGGILGLTGKWFAVPLDVLSWSEEKKKFVTNVPLEVLEEAPDMEKGKLPDEFEMHWLTKVYECFGTVPYWDSQKTEMQRDAAVGVDEIIVFSAGKLIGHSLRDRWGNDIGVIEDLIIDLHIGCIAYAVVSLRGIADFDNALFSVPLEAFVMVQETGSLFLDIDKERLKNAPRFSWAEFREDRRRLKEIYSYYGCLPCWQNEGVGILGESAIRQPQEEVMEFQSALLPASLIIGTKAKDIRGEIVGTIEDLMVDMGTGWLAYAILSSFGGSTNGGDGLCPVPIELLNFSSEEKLFYLNVGREIIENAPAFNKEKPPKEVFLISARQFCFSPKAFNNFGCHN